jgi:multiple sugar transport system ATP-binding protein
MLYVTHDQTEAMTLGDRVAVMRAGIIQQVDTPKTLYEDPANLFVAGFIGSPAMNFMPGRLEDGKLRLPFGEVPVPRGVDAKGRDVIAGIRPEHFEDARFEDREASDLLRFTARPEVVESMGSELYAYFDIQGGESLQSDQLDELAADAGMEDVPGAGTAVVARLDAASDATPGKDVELSLETGKIKLFDPDGGRSLTAA